MAMDDADAYDAVAVDPYLVCESCSPTSPADGCSAYHASPSSVGLPFQKC